ncbi:MAG TPA: hypothetical protein VMR96_01035 [Solirubrobacterales bacterium]|nr:hypothetical protein [Solirubrobacterales bacterium]
MPGQPAVQAAPPDLAGDYFEQLRERYEQAAAVAGGAGTLDLEMAGLRLRLRYLGEPLREALLAPFDHLACRDAGDPALTISLFDTAATGVEPPPPLWEPIAAAPGTNPVARLRSERACVLAAAGSRALTAALPAEGVAVFHLPDAAAVPPAERAAPIREALQLLLAARGRLMTHAGAVGRDGRGVLLVGRGGSGKSTLALSCTLAGMEIVADDYVLLDPTSLAAHAMQSTAKLTEDSAARLGIPAEAIGPAGFEPTLEGPAKALVSIPNLAPGRLKRRLEVAAVIAPKLSSSQPTYSGGGDELGEVEGPAVRAISAAEALRAVAPSTIVQAGFGGGDSLATLADLVRRVPSYALELSPNPAANAAAVERLVAGLG